MYQRRTRANLVISKSWFQQESSRDKYDSDDEKREKEEMNSLIADELRKRRGPKRSVNYHAAKGNIQYPDMFIYLFFVI